MRPAAPNRTQLALGTAEGRQSARALARDERLETSVEKSRFLADPAQAGGLGQELLIQIECRPHLHQYALFVQIGKSAAVTPGPRGKPRTDRGLWVGPVGVLWR